MTFSKKIALCSLILAVTGAAAFAQPTEIKGKLVKATKNGVNITDIFEPIVSITQDEILGVQSIKIELSGAWPLNSKVYEFYNDGKNESPIIWKRRMRGVVVQPIRVFITERETEEGNLLYINYEYKDSKGFGSVDYIFATAK
jgi:hypothetical protein